MIKTTEDVDWTAVERHYSHYSQQELEEMTYPKNNQRHSLTEAGESHQRFRKNQFD